MQAAPVEAASSTRGDVLPVGLPVLAQASLAAAASCDLLLQGIRLVPPAEEAGERRAHQLIIACLPAL